MRCCRIRPWSALAGTTRSWGAARGWPAVVAAGAFASPGVGDGCHGWDYDGARLQLSVEGAVPSAAWWGLARQAIELALQRGRQAGQIKALEEAERLQQALFQIADLAGADLEMSEMLRHVHGVLGTLMYAENCYIVEYDDVRDQIRFLYFADQVDDFVADPAQSHAAEEMPRSLTVALLRHGKPLSGPSRELLARVVEQEHDPQRGPESLDWLGVPMLRDGRVCGAIVVQSYELAARYGEAERCWALLPSTCRPRWIGARRRSGWNSRWSGARWSCSAPTTACRRKWPSAVAPSSCRLRTTSPRWRCRPTAWPSSTGRYTVWSGGCWMRATSTSRW